jgi:hypothetical protein
MTTCARQGCSNVVAQPKTGRRRKTCSPACRVAVHRERRRLLAPFLAAGLVKNGTGPLRLADADLRVWRRAEPGQVPAYVIGLVELGLDPDDLTGDPLDGARVKLRPGPAKGTPRPPRRERQAA